jgi:hypothetical protein
MIENEHDFTTGTFLPALRKRQDEIGKTLSPKGFIEKIRNLPDHWMEYQHGIRMDFSYQEKDSIIFKLARNEYRYKAKWLEFDLLNHLEVLFEVVNTDACRYKLFEQRTLSFKQLASAVCSYPSSWAQEQKIDPLLWTLFCEAQLCEISLQNSGYINECAMPTGKVEQYNWGMQHCGWLEDVDQLPFHREDGNSPKGALEKHAAWIARSNIEFRHTCYADYLREQKRYYRRLKNSKFNCVYLDINGDIRFLSRGHDARTPQKKKEQGFG